MNVKSIKKTHLIFVMAVLAVSSLYGIDKWVDSKIASHPVIVLDGAYIDDNEKEIVRTKDLMLRLEDKIEKLNDRIEELLMMELYP